jgi:hypothetical protein
VADIRAFNGISTTEDGAQVVTRALEAVAAAQNGTRHNLTLALVRQLGEALRARQVSLKDIEAVRAEMKDAGFEEDDYRRTFDDTLRHAAGDEIVEARYPKFDTHPQNGRSAHGLTVFAQLSNAIQFPGYRGMISGGQGTGKTEIALKFLALLDLPGARPADGGKMHPGALVVYSAPTLAKAEEAADRYTHLGGRNAMVYRGMTAVDPDSHPDPKKRLKMCLRPSVADKVSAQTEHSAYDELCRLPKAVKSGNLADPKVCDKARDCGRVNIQMRQLHALRETGGVIFTSHASAAGGLIQIEGKIVKPVVWVADEMLGLDLATNIDTVRIADLGDPLELPQPRAQEPLERDLDGELVLKDALERAAAGERGTLKLVRGRLGRERLEHMAAAFRQRFAWTRLGLEFLEEVTSGDDEAVAAAIENRKDPTTRHLAEICDDLIVELESGRDDILGISAVMAESEDTGKWEPLKGFVQHHRVRQFRTLQDERTSVVHLDGTGDAAIAEKVFRKFDDAVHLPVERHAKVGAVRPVSSWASKHLAPISPNDPLTARQKALGARLGRQGAGRRISPASAAYGR